MITCGNGRHMDEFTYSNLCVILGKLDGIAYGIMDEKVRAYLEDLYRHLKGLLAESEGE